MDLKATIDSDIIDRFDLSLFERDGFMIIKDFLSLEQVEELKSKGQKLAHESCLDEQHPVIKFNTRSNVQASSEYFLNSGDKISFFYEEGAIDENGQFKIPRQLALNKIGHGLHLCDKVFQSASNSIKIKNLMSSLGFIHPIVLQSMFIFKNPGVGGEVVPHQDSTFIYTQPLSTVGFWFALDDCNLENGTLEFIPGSHKVKRMIRNSKGHGTTFEGPAYSFDQSRFKPFLIPKGSLVLIHGSVVHQSGPNLSNKSRNAYTFHVIEGNHSYDELNWLQPVGKGFDYMY